MKVAALFVQRGGAYAELDGVDPWDEERDARRYAGPHPVVAHPPCARWCRLAALVEANHPHLRRGEDGGLFKVALDAVRRFGGVLEHPAYSDAFAAYGLPIPPTGGGWQRGICGGWSCYVEQGRYGHAAKKATWLYAYGVDSPPSLKWGMCPDLESWCGNRATEERMALDGGMSRERRRARVGGFMHDGAPKRRRLGPKEAAATPDAFRDELIGIARGAWGRRRAPKQPGDQPELSAKARAATPEPFRDTLIEIARSAKPTER